MTDDEHLQAFENLTLPFPQWTHRAHVKIAFTYLHRHPFIEALIRMRDGVKSYNARHAVLESPTSGYNETTTHAFLHLIAATMQAYGTTHPTPDADAFCDMHPQLASFKRNDATNPIRKSHLKMVVAPRFDEYNSFHTGLLQRLNRMQYLVRLG
jgi:hypothetical protein